MKDLPQIANSCQKQFDPSNINVKMRTDFTPKVKMIIILTTNFARIASEQRKNLFKL